MRKLLCKRLRPLGEKASLSKNLKRDFKYFQLFVKYGDNCLLKISFYCIWTDYGEDLTATLPNAVIVESSSLLWGTLVKIVIFEYWFLIVLSHFCPLYCIVTLLSSLLYCHTFVLFSLLFLPWVVRSGVV